MHRPDDYVAAAQLGLLYLAADQNALAMPILEECLAHADSGHRQPRPHGAEDAAACSKRTRRADDSPLDPRLLGERSYQAGFLKDAKRYFLAAREQNPVDAAIALKLGWTNNMLHDDAAALHWFDIARKSDDPAIAAEASTSVRESAPGRRALPHHALGLSALFLALARSLRLRPGQDGNEDEEDSRSVPTFRCDSWATNGAPPAASRRRISRKARSSSASGVATRSWHGAMGWFEAGTTIGYLNGTHLPRLSRRRFLLQNHRRVPGCRTWRMVPRNHGGQRVRQPLR